MSANMVNNNAVNVEHAIKIVIPSRLAKCRFYFYFLLAFTCVGALLGIGVSAFAAFVGDGDFSWGAMMEEAADISSVTTAGLIGGGIGFVSTSIVLILDKCYCGPNDIADQMEDDEFVSKIRRISFVGIGLLLVTALCLWLMDADSEWLAWVALGLSLIGGLSGLYVVVRAGCYLFTGGRGMPNGSSSNAPYPVHRGATTGGQNGRNDRESPDDSRVVQNQIRRLQKTVPVKSSNDYYGDQPLYQDTYAGDTVHDYDNRQSRTTGTYDGREDTSTGIYNQREGHESYYGEPSYTSYTPYSDQPVYRGQQGEI